MKAGKIAIIVTVIVVLFFVNLSVDFKVVSTTARRLVFREQNVSTEMKKILIWNSAWRIEAASFGTGHQAFVSNQCKQQQCTVITNTAAVNLSEIDAFVMIMHELWLTELPSFQRRPSQRFVFFTQESPTTMPINPADYNNYFNWTMSYRLNSDVQMLYGRVSPKVEGLKFADRAITKDNYAVNKTKLVAWFVSHCETVSLRENYVAELVKHIPVDIYGQCGNLSCNRNDDDWLSYPECYDMIERDYKFYLSFENSLCTDYATEKFFNILQRRVVPVVYGGANYTLLAPEHSYIDANQLSPKDLADYLYKVAGNDTLYNEYFWWKDFYDVEAGVEQMSRHAFCDLCEKLHTDSTTKVYEDLVPEWGPDVQCTQPKDWLLNPTPIPAPFTHQSSTQDPLPVSLSP